MEQAVLVGAVVLFLIFILWNGLVRAPLRRSVRARLEVPDGADEELESLLSQLREGAKPGPILRQLKKRIADEPAPELQAAYLCAVGDVLASTVSRQATALRYYVKALEADPVCQRARHGMRALLLKQRRGFRLEQLYWQLLARLDFDKHGVEEVTDAWGELADLLDRRRSGRKRAQALRRMLARVLPDEETSNDRDSDD